LRLIGGEYAKIARKLTLSRCAKRKNDLFSFEEPYSLEEVHITWKRSK
jgi:hypothetical protein